MSADSGPGRREVAVRLFAAEFDDASLSYSESDEERAPNYVITPTGARVNRLFAVGVLTEVESVNDDVLRGRIADPTGAFVTYAGQYQPDAVAFIEQTTPPAFVALTGKARTFEPEDSDRVFTSARPESVNAVDGDTRDRWVVATAEATLRRVAVFAGAIESDLRGDDLQAALEAADVEPALASGIPLAIDHYGTTTAYLEAVRQLAVDALELVAGDREEVRSLDVAPGEGGSAALGALPSVDIDLEAAARTVDTSAAEAETAADEPATADEPVAADGSVAADEATSASTSTAATDEAATAASGDAAASTDSLVDTDDETAAEPAEAVDVGGDTSADTDAESEPSVGSEPAAESDSTVETTPTADADDSVADETSTASTGSLTDAGTGAAEPAEAAGPTDGEPSGLEDDEPSGLGDFDDLDDASDEETGGLGDFDSGSDSDTDDSGTDTSGGDLYELDEDERAEVEAEFGTEFSTGHEVDDPGEADIDVPDADDLDAASEEDLDEATAEVPSAEPAETVDTEATDAADAAGDGVVDEGDDEDDQTVDPADVNLEAAAIDAMESLDDGNGADRETVVDTVVDECGVDADDVEDAIQDALMSGQCYEPEEGTLKAI